MEAELESEEPTEMGGDVSTSEDEGHRSIVTTSVECREPTVASISGEREVERRGDVPMTRKRATSLDAIGEWGAKRMRSPRPSEVSPASSPPAVGVVG